MPQLHKKIVKNDQKTLVPFNKSQTSPNRKNHSPCPENPCSGNCTCCCSFQTVHQLRVYTAFILKLSTESSGKLQHPGFILLHISNTTEFNRKYKGRHNTDSLIPWNKPNMIPAVTSVIPTTERYMWGSNGMPKNSTSGNTRAKRTNALRYNNSWYHRKVKWDVNIVIHSNLNYDCKSAQ